MEAKASPIKDEDSRITVHYSENRDQLRVTLGARSNWQPSDHYLSLNRSDSGEVLGIRISAFSYVIEPALNIADTTMSEPLSLKAVIDAAVTASSLMKHREGLSDADQRNYSEARAFCVKHSALIQPDALRECTDTIIRRRDRLSSPFLPEKRGV